MYINTNIILTIFIMAIQLIIIFFIDDYCTLKYIFYALFVVLIFHFMCMLCVFDKEYIINVINCKLFTNSSF